MQEDNLRYSRATRFKHFVSDIVDEQTAQKIYERFDELPDRICIKIDNAIFEDLEYRGYSKVDE